MGAEPGKRLTPSQIERLHDLFSQHIDGLAIYLSRWIAASEIEDILQDVWLKIQEGKAGEGFSKRWLFTVAKNHAVDQFRKRRPHRLRNDQERDFASDDDPVAELLATEKFQYLEECLQSLNHQKRELLKGSIAGVEVAVLAQMHVIAPEEVSRIIYRGKLAVRKCLEQKLA